MKIRHTSKRPHKLLLAFCALISLSLTSLHATIVAYDSAADADYTTGNSIDTINGGTGWQSAWSGSGWALAGSGETSLTTSGTVLPAPDKYFSAGSNARSGRGIYATPQVDTGSNYYISFMIQVSATIGATDFAAIELYNGARPATSGDSARVLEIGLLGSSGTTSNGSFEMRANNDANKLVTVGTKTTNVHQIVVKIESNAGGTFDDVVSVWYDPASEGDTPAQIIGIDLPFSHLYMASFGDSLKVDEIRVGTSWSDVTAATSANGITLSQTGLTIDENGGTGTFTAVLTSTPTSNVVLDITSSATAEGTVSPAQLTFTAANWNTPQTVTVTGVNDSAETTTDSTTITVAVNTGSTLDTNYSGLSAQTVTAQFTNDDGAGAGAYYVHDFNSATVGAAIVGQTTNTLAWAEDFPSTAIFTVGSFAGSNALSVGTAVGGGVRWVPTTATEWGFNFDASSSVITFSFDVGRDADALGDNGPTLYLLGDTSAGSSTKLIEYLFYGNADGVAFKYDDGVNASRQQAFAGGVATGPFPAGSMVNISTTIDFANNQITSAKVDGVEKLTVPLTLKSSPQNIGVGVFKTVLTETNIYFDNIKVVDASPAPTGGFTTWAAGLSDTSVTGDPDNDGIQNSLEYALGFQGNTPNTLSENISTESTSSTISLVYKLDTALTGVTYSVETATSLSGTWTTTGVTDTLVSTAGSVQTRKATVTLPGSGGQFLRLKTVVTP